MDVQRREALEQLCAALLVSGMELTRLPLSISQYVSSNFCLFECFLSRFLLVSIIGCLGSLGFDWDFNPDLGPFIFALVSSGRVAPC